MPTESLETKVQLAKRVAGGESCRVVFIAHHYPGSISQGDALRWIGKRGRIDAPYLFIDYYDANGADALLAPLADVLIGDIVSCYAHLKTEQDEIRKALRRITVVEPTFSTKMPQDVKDRIERLEAFRVTTEKDKYPQLSGASQRKWKARCAALYAGGQDINAADMPPKVEDGFSLNHHLVMKKEVKTYQEAAQLTLDTLVTGLRDKYTEPSVDDKKQAMRDAFGVFFDKVVRVVEAHEEKAIRSLSSEEPALTEALTKRFGPRAEAVEQRAEAASSKGGNAFAVAAQEAGFNPGLAAARKELKKCTFGRLQTPTGVERAPNNMYPPYVAERIKAGFLKSKNLARAWTNHKPRRKRANT